MTNAIRCSKHSLLGLVALLSFFLVCPYRAASQLQQQVDNQSVLNIENPIETSGELTLHRNELAQEAQDLDALARWEGKQILIYTGRLPGATGNVIAATSGAIFANSKDVQEISNKLGDSAEAFGKALAKFQQAKLDFSAGQIRRWMDETREGIAFANDSKSDMADAVSQTEAIVKRSTKVVTVDWDPDLASEIAKRMWKERPEFAAAARQFAVVGNLMQHQEEILELEKTYNLRISELNRELVNQELSKEFGSLNSFPAVEPKQESKMATQPGRSLPATLKQTPEGLVYNPDALTPAEQAARKINEQKMVDEMIKMRRSASGASQLDQAVTLKSWLDGGDRSLPPS